MTLPRGDVYLVAPAPGKNPRRARPLVVVSRQALCDSGAGKVVWVPVNSHSDHTARRGAEPRQLAPGAEFLSHEIVELGQDRPRDDPRLPILFEQPEEG